MVRIILGVIAGFIAWSILWVGSDQVLISASSGWYGAHQHQMETAMINQTPFTADTTIMLLRLICSIVFSVMAGFLAVFISNEHTKTTLGLGILLLLTGLFVQISVWNLMPVWFHVLFLILLIPMTILGGKLKKTGSAAAA
jgi:hypothetical protein